MKNKLRLILLNIVGSIVVILISFHIIKGEFEVNTPLSANDNNISIINQIDKEDNNTIYSLEIEKKISFKIKTPENINNKLFKQIYITDKEIVNKIPLHNRDMIVDKHSNIENIIDKNYTKDSVVIDKIDNKSNNIIEINDNDRNETDKDNYYYPYVWAVEWPFKKDIDESNNTEDTFITDETIEDIIEKVGGEIGNKILIIIFKTEKRLELWMDIAGEYKFLKSYPIISYSGKLGAKVSIKDKQAPEGYYSINIHRIIRKDELFTKLDLGFPNRYDKEHNVSSGYASIHNPSIQEDGFVIDNNNISEIYNIVQEALLNGYKTIPVYIYPFVMTQYNLERYYNSRWIDFWRNIKEGYDYFNRYHRTPKIEIRNGRYIFHIL